MRTILKKFVDISVTLNEYIGTGIGKRWWYWYRDEYGGTGIGTSMVVLV